ncbi:MAG: hypothetical protein ACK56I_19570 [bacterium]
MQAKEPGRRPRRIPLVIADRQGDRMPSRNPSKSVDDRYSGRLDCRNQSTDDADESSHEEAIEQPESHHLRNCKGELMRHGQMHHVQQAASHGNSHDPTKK